MKYDVIIIGGGPAAVAAGVYAARKSMTAAVIADQIGGQSVVSDGIENWIGEKLIPGPELAKKLTDHLEGYKEVIDLKIPEKVEGITKTNDDYHVATTKGSYVAKSIILCSGGRHRRLGIVGEDQFEGKGVAFCATCDAPFFRDKDVAVVGGGNSGLEAVVDLLPYVNKVYLLVRDDAPHGDPVTLKEVEESDKVTIIPYADSKEVKGDVMVEALLYENNQTQEKKEVAVQGIFVEIGSVPNSEIVKDLVEINGFGEVIVDHKTNVTSDHGIFAAGDVTDGPYKQNNIAVGDAIKALLSAYDYAKKKK